MLAAVLAAALAAPTIQVTALSPLTVRGAHFRAGERVRVTATTKARAARTVAVTARGTFVVRFTRLPVARCPIYAVSAVGDRGSHAFLKIAADCPPPLDDLHPLDP